MRLPFRQLGAAVAAAACLATAVIAGTTTASPIDEPATLAASADGQAVRTELPEHPRRPEVYLAYTGAQALISADPASWSFVRSNLDGWWGNVARVSVDQAIALTRATTTRDLVIERDIAPGGVCVPFTGPTIDFFQSVERAAQDIRFERRGAALYAGSNPNCWGASGGVDVAREAYTRSGYPEVIALYQPQNTSGALNSGAFPTFSPGSSGDVAYRGADGVALECPVDACTDPTFGAPFFDALQAAHARGVPFTWYTANSRLYGITSGWLGRIQNTYNAVAAFGLWRPEDRIVIVHNDQAGSYAMLPERNADGSAADTTTGILYWLLRQQPISTLCPDAVAC